MVVGLPSNANTSIFEHMTTNKLVDGDFLGKLLSSSFEVAMGSVDEAVTAKADLFGGSDDVEVRTLGTFPGHVIVVNSEGDFFRAAYESADGEISIGDVERIEVPVHEAKELSAQVRESSGKAVDAMLSGKTEEAAESIESLYRLVQTGIRLTAESIEDDLTRVTEGSKDWFDAVRENEKSMRRFVGAEAHSAQLPKPRFEAVVEAEEMDEDRVRKVVSKALRSLRSVTEELRDRLALARQVNEDYTLRVEGEAEMAATDYIDFVEQLDSELDAMKEIAESAISVSDDGSVKSLARIHDGITERMYEMGLATMFAEKFARRFEAPQAA